MLRLWAGIDWARADTGMGVPGVSRESAVRALMTLVRLAGRMGTWSLLASMTLPVSASTRIQAPGWGGGGGGLGAANALAGAMRMTSSTTTRLAIPRRPRHSMDCRVSSESP